MTGEGADIVQPLDRYSSRGKLIPLHGMTEAFSAKNQRIAWQNMQKENDMKPADNNSNMQNKNKGTPGTNKQYDKNQGNRGKQLNPNNKKK